MPNPRSKHPQYANLCPIDGPTRSLAYPDTLFGIDATTASTCERPPHTYLIWPAVDISPITLYL